MKIRELTISKSSNLSGHREFNHLRIANLSEFLSSYSNNLDYYKAPFSILADLENKIKFENHPEKTILSSYKPDGEIIFELVNIREEDSLRIVEYKFLTSVS